MMEAQGAVLYTDESHPVQLKRPVVRRSSILLGELVAILLVTEYVIEDFDSISSTTVKIFSDSQSAVGIFSLN